MSFLSILFDRTGVQKETAEQPEYFIDLNLDQIIEAITAHKEEYNLKPFFYTPLRDVRIIRYRQAVMQDLEDEKLMEHINAFARKMVSARRYLALVEKLDFKYHKKGWFLEAALVYCEAVRDLERDLDQVELKSRGFSAFHEYVTNYIHFLHAERVSQTVAGRSIQVIYIL